MNNLPALFLGIFFTIAFSWVGIVLVNQIQLGGLQRTSETLDEDGQVIAGDPLYPQPISGMAKRGKRVYESLGCMYCHSQQVRPQGFGTDYERAWGDRGSVARDYIDQDRVLLGTSRTGPDLMTIGDRLSDPSWHHIHLYAPRQATPGSQMPPFRFLYEKRKIDPVRGPSPRALDLRGEFTPPDGYEVVPTERAEELVAYLLSLTQDYDLPEVRFGKIDAEAAEAAAAEAEASGEGEAEPANGETANGEATTEPEEEQVEEESSEESSEVEESDEIDDSETEEVDTEGGVRRI